MVQLNRISMGMRRYITFELKIVCTMYVHHIKSEYFYNLKSRFACDVSIKYNFAAIYWELIKLHAYNIHIYVENLQLCIYSLHLIPFFLISGMGIMRYVELPPAVLSVL